MPIKFRCSHCRQFLGISPTKAGELTDCPACGRTVRVPNLDGTVAPLPTTRIDPGDSQLAEALSALSRIGEPVPTTQSAVAAVIATRPIATPTPAPVAIPIPPPLPTDRVEPTLASVSTSPSYGEGAPDLLFIPDDPADKPARLHSRGGRPRELRIAALILAAAALLLIGFFAGRAFEQRSSRQLPTPAAAPQVARPAAVRPQPAQAQVADPVSVTGVGGTITWQTADGQTRNDGGTRVIAFPAVRPAQPPLAVAGFRAGAVGNERQRATTAIRDASGDCVVADDTGRYSLQLAAGQYDLLILSRHQPRDSTLPLDARINELLAAWFDQPSGLVGSVAVAHFSVDFDGSSLRLDHAFSR